MAGIVGSVISDQMKKDWGAFWGSGAGSTYSFGSSAVKGTNNGDGTATLKWNDGRTSTVKQSEGIDGIAGRDNTLAQEWGYTYGYDKGKDFSAPAAVTANATGYQATERAVQGTDLTSHHLNRILSEGSPLLEQAAGKAMQMAGARGLVNSSMAAQAGTEAMISQALPVASQDANTYFTQGRANQDADNSAKAFNANAENQVSMFNASAKNTANLAGFNANVGMERDRRSNVFAAEQAQLGRDFSAGQAQLGRDYQAAQDQKNRDFTAEQNAIVRAEDRRRADEALAFSRETLRDGQFTRYRDAYLSILNGADSQETKASKLGHLQNLYFGTGFAPSSGIAAGISNNLPAILPGASQVGGLPVQGPAAPGGQQNIPAGAQITLGGVSGTVVQGANGKRYLQTANGEYYEIDESPGQTTHYQLPDNRAPGGKQADYQLPDNRAPGAKLADDTQGTPPYYGADPLHGGRMGIGNVFRGPQYPDTLANRGFL